MKTPLLFFVLLIPCLLWAQKDFSVTVHEIVDPDGFNPITSNAANALHMQSNVFQKLLDYDPQTLTLQPVLAKALPIVRELEEGKYKGGMSISYEIHPDAVWDNGLPVTAYDYLFTIKVIKNPKVHARYLRLYFEFIEEMIIDPINPKKFTIYSSQRYFKGVEISGQETFVLPEYHYDPQQQMRAFSLETLNDPEQSEALKNKAEMRAFAKVFNDRPYAQDPTQVIGSGPYTLTEWSVRKVVVFKKKKNWWGDAIKGNRLLAAYPSEIRYVINSDMSFALEQAKAGQLDIIRDIPPSRFAELENDRTFHKASQLSSSPQFAYYYLALNAAHPKLEDLRVRKAIAHAVDRTAIIKDVMEGYARPTKSPVSPTKAYYHHGLPDIQLDLEQAKVYLAEAGWTDSDGDGVLDKIIDGKLEPLYFNYIYNQGNRVRKAIGILLRDNLRKIGVGLTVEPVDFMTLLTRANEQDFEIMALAWVHTAGLDDLEQVWGKEAAYNRVNFGDTASDALLAELKVTLDETQRNKLYYDIQERIAASHCYVFLMVPDALIAISKRFRTVPSSATRPGYVARFFQLKQ